MKQTVIKFSKLFIIFALPKTLVSAAVIHKCFQYVNKIKLKSYNSKLRLERELDHWIAIDFFQIFISEFWKILWEQFYRSSAQKCIWQNTNLTDSISELISNALLHFQVISRSLLFFKIGFKWPFCIWRILEHSVVSWTILKEYTCFVKTNYFSYYVGKLKLQH